jgi:hypothetical protein
MIHPCPILLNRRISPRLFLARHGNLIFRSTQGFDVFTGASVLSHLIDMFLFSLSLFVYEIDILISTCMQARRARWEK